MLGWAAERGPPQHTFYCRLSSRMGSEHNCRSDADPTFVLEILHIGLTTEAIKETVYCTRPARHQHRSFDLAAHDGHRLPAKIDPLFAQTDPHNPSACRSLIRNEFVLAQASLPERTKTAIGRTRDRVLKDT